MKAVAVLLVLSASLASVAVAQFDFTNIDPTPFLQNRALVRRALNCVLGTGACDAIGQYARRAVVEVMSRNCRSCTPQQAATAQRLLQFIRTNYPAEYTQIYNMYRPSG